jgi:hypothetical protein
MSNEEAEDLTESLEKKWDDKHAKNFVARMEHKLYRKERFGRS